MKILLSLAILILSILSFNSLTSCAVLVVKDNGAHKGLYKNSNNPHHPYSINPGKIKGNRENKL